MSPQSSRSREPPSRAALHGVLTIGGALAVAGGEAAGNFLFRGGTITWSELVDQAIVGAVLGNVVAFLLWKMQRRSTS